jgi:hypothetical protein
LFDICHPKAAALTLARYAHLEAIPKGWQAWHPSIRKARTLAATLFDVWDDVLLYRTLATLRLDVRTFDHGRRAPLDRPVHGLRGLLPPSFLKERSYRG